ncbi:hydantoinase B/oxoprolinase family protein [Mesorhizobium australicum]|uniref:N-methylhydantoinase B n=1 Tax=Mesorhizobium australicum TaxID=536018 RepID=A0A1X7MZX1_9HYPH|nr:hydantoinase B/oxoprolinase family protein [Mesorhizobium australicum]SMH29597.1 N-methylhydantoinase B [Mesorhizobium australicum]
MTGANAKLSPIRLQVAWNRLIALVEEQAQTLLRTAFSSIVRECGDLSAGIFDRSGRMLAQAVTGTPGHINTMARSVFSFIEAFPVDMLREGDILVTNDPWKGTGHLNDYVVVTPAFRDGRVLALFACTGHMTDVGGIGLSAEGSDIFCEGVHLPVMKLADAGRIDETLMRIVKSNSRVPAEIEGDIYSLIASNEVAVKRLRELMDEAELDDLEEVADHILSSSREAVKARIAALPRGTATYRMTIDGFEAPVELVGTLTISEVGVSFDWTGTTGLSRYGINVPLNYTTAMTAYALVCSVAPDVPNNEGGLSQFAVSAPEGSILNATWPSPVACRHIIGLLLPDVVFGCVDQLMPGKVPAEGASTQWTLTFRGSDGLQRYAISIVTNGGSGARPGIDGLSATSFPSNVRGTPVEIVESETPLVFWKRELRDGSGGDGRWRGGMGQDMEIGTTGDAPFTLFASFDRIDHPARGRDGGDSGAAGELHLSDGQRLSGKGAHVIAPGKRLLIRTPGGGGYGAVITGTDNHNL